MVVVIYRIPNIKYIILHLITLYKLLFAIKLQKELNINECLKYK